MHAPPTRQISGIYHRRIGDIAVTALSDGFLDGTLDVLRGISQAEGERLLAESFRGPGRRTAVNCFAIRAAGRLALIETGSGDYLQPTAGRLPESLAAAGIDPAAVEAVLLTHMHPDHSAGLADRATGARRFPNAELVVHEADWRHWHDDSAMARADDRARALYFQCAREQTAPYRDRLRLIGAGEVFPGVRALPAPGHTPGHTCYLVESDGESLLIWGDTVHVPEIQTARPEVTIAFDSDPPAAAASRRRVFDMAAADRLLVAGMHLHFPGFARLARRGEGYALVPEAWAYEM